MCLSTKISKFKVNGRSSKFTDRRTGVKAKLLGVKGTKIKVCLNRYSWDSGKVGYEYSSWFIQLECIS